MHRQSNLAGAHLIEHAGVDLGWQWKCSPIGLQIAMYMCLRPYGYRWGNHWFETIHETSSKIARIIHKVLLFLRKFRKHILIPVL